MPNTKLCDNLWLAIGFASINAFMLAGMSLFAKLLGQYFGPVEVTFFRNAFSLLALFGWLVCARKIFTLKTERPWAHLFRGAIGTAGITLGMWAVSLMSLAETTVLLFTSPLFTLILSIVFLKECVGPYRISAIILGFTGVLVIANPFAAELQLPLLGLIIGLGWGFFSGSVDTTLRWMGTTEKSSTTTFYFSLFGTLATALHWPFAEIHDQSFSLEALWIICGLRGMRPFGSSRQKPKLSTGRGLCNRAHNVHHDRLGRFVRLSILGPNPHMERHGRRHHHHLRKPDHPVQGTSKRAFKQKGQRAKPTKSTIKRLKQ